MFKYLKTTQFYYRFYSSNLTDRFDRFHDYLRISLTERCNLRLTFRLHSMNHVDDDGKAKMVNITSKSITKRQAKAQCLIKVSHQVLKLIMENNMKKGDVLTVAKLAGIMGAKKTSDLIPLCHGINITGINVQLILDEQNDQINVISTVECYDRTGVEMEALMSAAISALTIYDMCKAVTHQIVITDLRLLEKSGGKENFKY